MLRTVLLAFFLVSPPALAGADEIVGLHIRDEQTGATQGRVTHVAYNEEGRAVSVAAAGLAAPADAPPFLMAPRRGPAAPHSYAAEANAAALPAPAPTAGAPSRNAAR